MALNNHGRKVYPLQRQFVAVVQVIYRTSFDKCLGPGFFKHDNINLHFMLDFESLKNVMGIITKPQGTLTKIEASLHSGQKESTLILKK